MGRRWAVSLIIGAAVSAALLALYYLSAVFFRWTVKLEEFYQSVFILPVQGELMFSLPLQYVFFTVMAFVSAWVCMELTRVFSRVAYISGSIFLTLIISPVLAFCGLIFEPFSACLAILLAGLIGFAYDKFFGHDSHHLMHYFVGRVSTEAFQKMVTSPEAVKIGGKKEMTVLNCRILNYPELASEMSAEDLEKMGSLFLRAAAEFLVSRGAYLDSCNAQGVRVFFGMLDNSGTHAQDGCKVALELRQRLINLEQEMLNRWHRKAFFGVSLATGPLSLGLFGYREFQFYSAVGESVDFCRRLCSVNLVYGSHVLIDSRTFTVAQEHMETRPMEMVYAPQMHHIREVYELLAEKGALSEDEAKARDAFWQGVVNLRKEDYKEAALQFKKARIEGRDDAPLQYFQDKLEAALRDDKTEEIKPKVVSHARELKS